MTLKGGYWREATSLILTARKLDGMGVAKPSEPNLGLQQKTDYTVLMLKRSSKSSFAPNNLVFPGGVVDDQDFSLQWRTVFEKITSRDFKQIQSSFVNSKSGILKTTRDSPFPAEVAFRIAAIRETFEETGILLVRHKKNISQTSSFKRSDPIEAHISPDSMMSWRKRVRDDPSQFQVLCEKLAVVPDIWALKEWSNWITPVLQQVTEPPVKPRRFDTMFFVCCLENLPKATSDEGEISSLQWLAPSEVLSKFHREKSVEIWGPQHYELVRLGGHPCLDDLCRFSNERESEAEGLRKLMTYHIVYNDGYLSVLPGDDLYPEVVDYEGIRPLNRPTKNKSMKQCRLECTRLNRFERKQRDGTSVLYSNISTDGHPVPPADLIGSADSSTDSRL